MKPIYNTIVKYHGGDRYVFTRGVAIVPGLLIARQPVAITIKEFNGLTRKPRQRNKKHKR